MATADQFRVLANPAVYVDDQLIKVIPESVREHEPGERRVRAVSAGGRSVEHVVGLNVAEMKGRVTFRMAVTAEAIALVQDWSDKANKLVPVTVELTTETRQSSYRMMFLTDTPEYGYEAEGEVEVTFEGSLPVRS